MRRFFLLAFLAFSAPACERAPAARDSGTQHSIVLVTLDTTRRDRLSLYGYARPTSPNVDALAKTGVVFDDAWSQAPNTNPSIATSLTGRRAPVTGVRGNAERLRAEVPTLARIAHDAGYRTGAFVSTVLLRKDVSGLSPGFDVYDDEMSDPCFGHDNAQRVARKTVDRALAWLDAADPDDERPFFLWVHLYDPHGPYGAPEPTPGLDGSRASLPTEIDRATWKGPDYIPKYLRVDGLTEPEQYADAYDREIRYADEQLGRLFDRLDLDTTVVALHADHGESLGEDDYWFRHGALLHDPALRIPMFFAGPGLGPNVRIGHRARNLDLAPTLSSLAGLPTPPDAEGRDLSWVALHDSAATRGDGHGRPPLEPVSFVAEGRRREIVGDRTGIDVRWKLRFVEEHGCDVTWWPAADERRVQIGDAKDVVRAMDAMRNWLLGSDEAPDVGANQHDIDAMEALGYVAPSGTRTPERR